MNLAPLKSRCIPALFFVACFLMVAPHAKAEDDNTINEPEKYATEFTDPLTALPQLSLQDAYIPVSYGTPVQTNRFFGRLVVPRVPETSLLPLAQLIRPTFSMVTQTSAKGGPTRTAFGDIALLDLFVIPWPSRDSGLMMGIGPLFVFPTATESFAGQNAWQVGPSFAAVYKGFARFIVGGLIQNSFSFAYTTADHQSINALLIQPVFAYYLGRGFYLRSADSSFKLEWAKGGAKILPVGLGIGYVVRRERAPPLNFFVSGEQTVYRENARVAPGTTVRFGATIAFPEMSPW